MLKTRAYAATSKTSPLASVIEVASLK